jgi:hypothetical protein
MGLEKDIRFGRAIPPKATAGVATGSMVTSAGSTKPAPKQPVQRPYQLSLSLYANNVLNHTNEGNPVGSMASPFFLKSTGASSQFIFCPGGGASGNRQLSVRVRLSF